MRMSLLKWVLVAALLLAAALLAYIRISDAINDIEMQNPPQEFQPQPPSRPWLHDPLIRT